MKFDDIGEFYSPIPNHRLPSLNALRCFEAAARLQHFGQAAEELHLTHGAISRAVRTLEEDLGVALFERRNRRVFLTDPGRDLAQAVHEGLERIRQTTQQIRAAARSANQLTLSCEPTLLMRWLIPRWPRFQKIAVSKFPDAQVHLVAGGGPFTFANGIDLAIRRNDFSWPEQVHVEPLFDEFLGPVYRPEKVGSWFRLTSAKPALRSAAPRLHTRTRPKAWATWATSAHTKPPTQVPASQSKDQLFEHFYFSLQAAIAGLGVAIGPWHLVMDDIDSGVLAAPLGFVADGSQYCLLSQAVAPEGSLQQLLLQWLQAETNRAPPA